MNNKRNLLDQLIRIFFYVAPLIGLLYGVYYLQSQNKATEVCIEKEKLEKIVIGLVQKLDSKDCIEDKKIEIEVDKLILNLK